MNRHNIWEMKMDSINFEIGTRFENMKGLCEVITLDGEQMCIRWLDSGEEINTTITMQQRIQGAMQRLQEERMRAPKNKRSVSLKEHGTLFNGLTEADFKDNVGGTCWRSRQQLGGAVTRLLVTNKAVIESCSVYRRPEIQWGDIAHGKKEKAWLLGKFDCLVDEQSLTCSFLIERSDTPERPGDDWTRFMDWLSVRDNQHWLHKTMAEHNLVIWDRCTLFAGSILPVTEGCKWLIPTGGTTTGELKALDALPQFLATLTADKWVNLFIGTKIPKATAIAHGKDVAADIAKIFNVIMPAYEYIITGEQA